MFIVMAISDTRGWARDAVVSFHSAADQLVILPDWWNLWRSDLKTLESLVPQACTFRSELRIL